MKVTGWTNGRGTYGIRVGKNDAREHFDRTWASVVIEVAGVSEEYPLAATFWTTCPEFRGRTIGAWLVREGFAPWPAQQSPELDLVSVGERRFRLAR